MRLRSRFRKILLYGLSRGVTDGLLALRGLLLASLLGPEAFGGWALFRIATKYCGFAGLGVHSGLEFQVARIRDPGDRSSGNIYWRAALGFVLPVFGVIALGILAASCFVGDQRVALGMRWFAGAIITEQVWLYGLSFIRAMGDLRRYAVYEVTNAVLQVAFAAALTPVWGLGGAFASFVLATAVGLALLMLRVPLAPTISRARLGEMMTVGFPILISLVIGVTLASADRLVVAAHGGTPLLGLYALAVSVAGIAASLAWVIRIVIYPDVYARVAAEGEARALRDYLKGTVLPFARLFPPVLGMAAIVIGPIIAIALPEYLDAVSATRILMFLGATAGFERLGALGVVAAGRQKYLPFFSGVALIMNIVLSILALRFGFGLQGVAVAAVVSNAAFGLAALALVARLAQDTKPAALLLNAMKPLLWCALVVALFGGLRSELGVTYTTVSLGFYLVAVLPLLPSVLSELRKVWPIASASP